MKAISITPKRLRTAHLLDLPAPRLAEVPGDPGVPVQVLQVGVDGTDKELYLEEYGAAPEESGPRA